MSYVVGYGLGPYFTIFKCIKHIFKNYILWLMIVKQCKTRVFYIKIIRNMGVCEWEMGFIFRKSEVIFTKCCFIFVLFFDKSDYDHWF